MDLSPKRRRIVVILAAILRLAEALDREHGNKVHGFRLTVRGNKVYLLLKGEGDLLLERWALRHGAQLFEKTFKKKVVIER
jgi:exopolyphosphatase/guanosine-5'-triphosphate,3'-diphosphate pyrophosphatase